MNITEILKKYEQEHLLRGVSDMSEDEKAEYFHALEQIDYELLARLYKNAGEQSTDRAKKIEPAQATELASLSQTKIEELSSRGLDILTDKKCAAVTLAGGQGTRLGYNGPKGCFDIGIGKSLFELQCEKLVSVAEKTGSAIPWYIMTSEENHADTISFFKRNNNFGYPSEELFFFMQGMLPMLCSNGKILLLSPGTIVSGPDGNGGVFKALHSSGALSDITRRGIEYVFFCGIDNALVKMCDPVFLGFTAQSGLPCSSKSVLKRIPDERVGVFCKLDGRPCTIEYTELREELRCAADKNGALLYGDSNIVSHILTTSALKTICWNGLPYHAAFKKAQCLGENGQIIDPEGPNAYKFETFIFDAFSSLEAMAVLRVKREEEFAPVKNCTGEDSPETALLLLKRNGLA